MGSHRDTMQAWTLVLVSCTTLQFTVGDLSGFFAEIHDGGYPSFEWLDTDFAHGEIPRETPETGADREREMQKVSHPEKVVKRHPSHLSEDRQFNPSKFYYANIENEENDILEPVIKKVYQENKEDYHIPVYNEKTSLYEVHGVGELPEDGVGDLPELSTLPTGHRYQPLNVLDHSDKQQYILEKYVEDKVRNYHHQQSSGENKQENTRKTENNFYSPNKFEEENQFIFPNADVGINRERFRDSYTNFPDTPRGGERERETYSQDFKPVHKQVKKSAQFSSSQTGNFNSFFDEIQENPNTRFPSFDFASSFPHFNDGAKFFQNDEKEKIFHLHNSGNEPERFVHF